jgi:hypothetical protein
MTFANCVAYLHCMPTLCLLHLLLEKILECLKLMKAVRTSSDEI